MRNYKRKSNRANFVPEDIKAAIAKVNAGESYASAARFHEIPLKTLWRYVKKDRNGENNFGYVKSRQFFTDEEETELKRYIIKASDIYFGLSAVGIRKLAFTYAVKLNKTIPDSWKTH